MLTNSVRLPAKEFKSRAAKAIWDFHGVYASSRHIPGVRFAGVSHPGLIGTAPSQELLDTWNAREGVLIAQHAGAVPPVAYPPEQKGAYVGQDLPDEVRAKVYREGARTIPGREHGGNCDVSEFAHRPYHWEEGSSADGRRGCVRCDGRRSRTCRRGRDATSQCSSRERTCLSGICISHKEM